jgi:hypothetical protein
MKRIFLTAFLAIVLLLSCSRATSNQDILATPTEATATPTEATDLKENFEQVQVTINQNLEDNNWYWTQFNLPEGGELLEKVDYAEYVDWNNISDTMANFRVTVHGNFYGTFCCAQTIPGKYVFLPTDDLNAEVDTLVYFGSDGSVWVIDVPGSLLTPVDGEVFTTAIVYR